jgi:hypothetical protein
MKHFRIKSINEKFNVEADVATLDDNGILNIISAHCTIASFREWDYFYEIRESCQESEEEEVNNSTC